jgi:hypothetical protein
MELKPDWNEAKERFIAWWEGEAVGRACLQVTAPRADCAPQPIPEPPTLEARWTDIDYVIRSSQERMRATFYGGEAFPVSWPNLGPDIFAAYLGCELIFKEGTSWAKPFIRDWASFPGFAFDPSNRWWRLTLEMLRAATEAGAGKYFVGLTDLHGGMDALSAARGRENLCLDLLDHPAHIRRAMDFLTPFWFEVYEQMHSIVQRKMQGSSTWIGLWSPGRMYAVSCDFCSMVSPRHFEEIILPDIAAEVDWLDHSVFHLDGPGALPHLDRLLEMPRLNAIQWVPGAGREDLHQWVPALKKIQRAGKSLLIHARPDEVEPLLAQLSADGLMISTHCDSEEHARWLLRKAGEWSRP